MPEQPDPGFLDRRAAAFQAYYENMPLRSTALPRGIDMRLYRQFAWGELATFHMLDTRQYRDDQACGDGTRVNCAERLDPNRTITGVEQERWLLDGFHRSRARWDVLGQQVFFAQRDLRVGAEQGFSMDAWDGYRANRDRVAAGLGNSGVRNGVVLTGDVALGGGGQGEPRPAGLPRRRRRARRHLDHQRRGRQRGHQRRGAGGEPAPQVLQEPSRLRPDQVHR